MFLLNIVSILDVIRYLFFLIFNQLSFYYYDQLFNVSQIIYMLYIAENNFWEHLQNNQAFFE